MVAAQAQLQKVLLFGILALALLIFALLLASVQSLALLGFGAMVWALTLPHHAKLALILGTTLVNASLLVPFFPGRPFFWEAGLLLGVSGLPLLFAMRQNDPAFGEKMRRYSWSFAGLALFLGVLFILIKKRGFGLNVLSQEKMGGRAYITQYIGALFPVLYMAVPTTPGLLVRLFCIHCFMGVTFIVSDLALASGGGPLWVLLSFFGLSNDSLFFAVQTMEGGGRRIQSLAIITRDLTYLTLCLVPASRILNLARPLWLLAILGLTLAGSLGGHRVSFVVAPAVILLCAHVQRVLTMGKVLMAMGAMGAVILGCYAFSRDLPFAAQRMISFLPGIQIDPVARADAEATALGRNLMRSVGWQIAPNYLILGRGLGFVPGVPSHNEIDTYGIIEQQIELGVFYSGAISLLVNTGIPGCIGIGLFLLGVTGVALRNLRRIRRVGCVTHFDRLCCLVSSVWLVQLVVFLTTTGDAGFTMTTFGMLSAMVMITNWHQTRPASVESSDPPGPSVPAALAARMARV